MNYPATALTILEALYQNGTNICVEIEKFQPDMVIGLAHSGWMPVVVAQTLWAQTRKGSFPPAMRTNVRTSRAQTTKNFLYRIVYRSTVRNLHCTSL